MNAAEQNPRTASQKPRPSKPERILVVNDEEPIREIISSMLTTAGYVCRTAADGLQALTMLDSGEEFDLVLCNLMMPSLDGMGLLERIHGRFPNMPFVLESGCKDFYVFGMALRNGAYDYLIEPFEREQLLIVVRRALEYRRLKLANREYEKKLGTLTIPTSHKPERILVQDDEETIREIISSMLVGVHYECRAVASPKEVLDILRSGEQFDLVLCGLLETGEKFFKRMGEQFPDIPLVVLSACHDLQLYLSALRDGVYDYLMKPFEREQLIFAVRRALEYRRLKLENREYQARLEKLAKKNSTVGRARR